MYKWIHARPKKYYPECLKLFGTPTASSNKKNGFALWKTKGLFKEHLLRDEDVKHCVPRHHHDYFYSSVEFFVPKDKVCDVLKISGSLNYDGLKKLLTARCGGIGANYATLYLAMLVASGKMSIQKVKKDDMYPRMISGKIMPHSQMRKKMMVLKKANQKKYHKELKLDFATYAFKKCHTKKRRRSKARGTKKRRTPRYTASKKPRKHSQTKSKKRAGDPSISPSTELNILKKEKDDIEREIEKREALAADNFALTIKIDELNRLQNVLVDHQTDFNILNQNNNPPANRYRQLRNNVSRAAARVNKIRTGNYHEDEGIDEATIKLGVQAADHIDYIKELNEDLNQINEEISALE